MDRRTFLSALGAAVWSGSRITLAGAAERGPSAAAAEAIHLTVERTSLQLGGRVRTATAVNGTVPGPVVTLREGTTARIVVANRLTVPTSVHWHGLRLPADQDGVPGLSFRGIAPGESFTYEFPVRQSGTYWYHAHSGMQEQTGLIGPLILLPSGAEIAPYDREYIVMLSDWSDEEPMKVLSNLKQESDYYNRHRQTLSAFLKETCHDGLRATIDDRLMWGQMRMSPTDIMDVTGATYTFLMNGLAPSASWTGLFEPGERVRLRFINGAAMTTFDVRLPGLELQVVAADGSAVEPVSIEEFRMGVGETYDVIVELREDRAYTIFAQAQDRSGFALGTLAPRVGMKGNVPPLDPRPVRTMSDMGMGRAAPSRALLGRPFVDNVVQAPQARLSEPGDGLTGNGRRVLVYSDLKSLSPDPDTRVPSREIEFHLTGNMQRYVWGFDGKKFSDAGPMRLALGERVRFVLVNDTMMEHPIHLHGFLFSLENGQSGRLPRKHTVQVKPAERLSFSFTADTPGYWAFHCHLMYHMDSGMFRTVLVA